VHLLTTLPVAFVSESALSALRSPHLHWRVHSVFRQALNLEAAGQLVAVAPQAAGGLPNGLAVSGNPDFQALGVARGMAMEGTWPTFEIPDASLRLELGRAWSWSPRLRPGTIDAHEPAVQSRVQLAAGIVAARATQVGFAQCVTLLRPALAPVGSSILGGPGSAGPADPDRAEGHLARLEDPSARAGLLAIEALRSAIALGDHEAAFSAADRLVGLGAGLTPSGDDVLVGLTAALRAAGHPLADPLSRHAARRSPDATTDVARAAHEHAAHGDYAERLHEVLDALAHGDDAAVRLRVERALAWGASSGADALLGMLIGLEAASVA